MSQDKKAGQLPHAGALEKAFGGNFLDAHKAHIDGMLKPNGAGSMGAQAFTTGDKIAFGAGPSRHTAAHEAAHVVQQRMGMPKK